MQNPNFMPDAGEYLQAAGFTKSEDGRFIQFTNWNTGCAIMGDNIDFFHYYDGDDDRERRFEPYMSLIGIKHIDTIFDWMLLFHLAGLVTIGQLAKQANKEEKYDLLKTIERNFHITKS